MRIHFEPPEDNSLWILNTSAHIDGTVAPRSGSNSLRLVWGAGSNRTARRSIAGLVPGRETPVWMYVNFDGMSSQFAEVQLNLSDALQQTDFFVSKGPSGATGWRLWLAGSFIPQQPTVLFKLVGNNPSGVIGQIAFDDIVVGEEFGFPLSRELEIGDAIEAGLKYVLVGNGFDVSLNEVRLGIGLVPDTSMGFPLVLWDHLNTDETQETLKHNGRIRCVSTYRVDVHCRRSAASVPERESMNAIGAIKKSLETWLDSSGHWKWFPPYVTNVNTPHNENVQVSEQVSRDIHKRSLLVEVIYSRAKGDA